MSKEQTWHSIPGSRALKSEPLNNMFSSLTLSHKASSVYMILVCELPPLSQLFLRISNYLWQGGCWLNWNCPRNLCLGDKNCAIDYFKLSLDIHVTLNKLKFMLNVLGVVPEAMLVKLLCVFLKVVGQNGSHLSSYKKDIDTLAVELIHIPGEFLTYCSLHDPCSASWIKWQQW